MAVEMAGPLGGGENKSRVSPLPPRPLKIPPPPQDPPIPPAGLRPRWGSEKPEPGSPLPHAGLATTTFFSIQLTKTQKGVRPGTPGHTSGFHAHSALEPSCSFMLILRLENAPESCLIQDEPGGGTVSHTR